MSTIIAICPYCRAGGVRAPGTAIGASATCPKCKSSFTVMPSDDVPPDWDKPAPKKPTPTFAPPPPSLAETSPSAALPDVTEPSPVIPAEARPRPAPPPPEAESLRAPADLGLVCALGSLCLVGPAMVATLLPYGRVIALVLCGAGLAAGVLALLAEGKARRVGALAVLLHLVALVVLLFFPRALDLDPWRGRTAPKLEHRGPVAIENATGAPGSAAADDWLDAARYSWQNGDARVSVRAGVGPVELVGPNGAKRTPKEQYLLLTLRVRNASFENDIALTGWAAGRDADGVRVTDAQGKPLALAKFADGWGPDPGVPVARAAPGHTSEVLLVFVAPLAKTDHVRVQLSGAAVGGKDDIKFRVGTSAPLVRDP